MVLKCAYVMIYMYELRKQMQHSVGDYVLVNTWSLK